VSNSKSKKSLAQSISRSIDPTNQPTKQPNNQTTKQLVFSISATSCTVCEPGRFSRQSGPECIACDAGTFASTNETRNECKKVKFQNVLSPPFPTPLTRYPSNPATQQPNDSCTNPPTHHTLPPKCAESEDYGSTFTSTTGATRCNLCVADWYWNSESCEPCPEGTECDQDGSTLSSLPVAQGWYRFTKYSTRVYPCMGGETACTGGQNVSTELCGAAYTDTLCSRCAEGFHMNTLTSTCEDCDDVNFTASIILLIVLVVIVFVGAILSRTKYSDWIRLVDFGKIRVLYTTSTILRAVPTVVNVKFPEPARTWFAALDLSYLSPFEVVSGECINRSLGSFDTAVTVQYIALVAVCVLNWLVFIFCITYRPARKLHPYSQAMSVFLGIMYLFYPTLTLMGTRALHCTTYDDGEITLLTYDNSIDCESERYLAFRRLNFLYIAITQMIPIGFLLVLYRARHLLHPPSERSPEAQLRARQKREQGHELKPLVFLFTHYKLEWPWCYFEVFESYRRAGLISFVQVIHQDALVRGFAGILIASLSATIYDKGRPFINQSTNNLAALCSQIVMFTYCGALLIRLGFGDNVVGGTIIMAANFGVIPISMYMHVVDRRVRAKREAKLRSLYAKLQICQEKDKKKFELAWNGYVKHARETGNEAVVGQLKANLAALEASVGDDIIPNLAHPASLAKNVDALMQVASDNNDMLHSVIKSMIEAVNGLYSQGPLKLKQRVLEKTRSDYKGNFLQVIDIVRASAVFHTLVDFNRAVLALQASGGVATIVRSKDRVFKPLDSGYRDVLLNITVQGCDMVIELQLHLKDVIAVKSEAHRIYDFLRTLGW